MTASCPSCGGSRPLPAWEAVLKLAEMADRPELACVRRLGDVEIVTQGTLMLARPVTDADAPVADDVVAEGARRYLAPSAPYPIDLDALLRLPAYRVLPCPCEDGTAHWGFDGDASCTLCGGGCWIARPLGPHTGLTIIGDAVLDGRLLGLAAQHLARGTGDTMRSEAPELDALLLRRGDLAAVVMPGRYDRSEAVRL